MLQGAAAQKEFTGKGPEDTDEFENQKRSQKNFDETKIMRW